MTDPFLEGDNMRMLLKIKGRGIWCVALIVCLVLMTGCAKSTDVSKGGEFLLASEYWYHFDEVRGEFEKMRFNEDTSFYWGCECGEPVGDSDCYERFAFDAKTSSLRLYNDFDDMSMEMEVLDYSDGHILLRMDGEIKDYTSEAMELNVMNHELDHEMYMDGYSGAFYMLDGNDEEVVLGPFDYDGDVTYPDNAKKTYTFSDDVEVYTLFVFTKVRDGQVIESKVDYEAISVSEAVDQMEYGVGGFVWFDDQVKVNKMVLYGEIRIEE